MNSHSLSDVGFNNNQNHFEYSSFHSHIPPKVAIPSASPPFPHPALAAIPLDSYESTNSHAAEISFLTSGVLNGGKDDCLVASARR